MRSSQYIFIVFLLFTVFCKGQEAYHTQWYSADNNYLPQNSVKSITPDKYGFIWLSTESGIIRFDGKNFKIFNSSNINNLVSDRMYVFGGSVSNDSITILNGSHQFLVIRERTVNIDAPRVSPPIKVNKGQFKWNVEFRLGLHYAQKGHVFRLASGNNTTYIIGNDSIRQYDLEYNLKSKYAYIPPADSLQFFGISGKLYVKGKNNCIISNEIKIKTINKKIAKIIAGISPKCL